MDHSKMKLLPCFVSFLLLKMYYAEQIPFLQDAIRIPWIETTPTVNNIEVPLRYEKQLFTGNISIGVSGINRETFRVQFDTGSRNLWVYSRDYVPQTSETHRRYNRTNKTPSPESGTACPVKSIQFYLGCVDGPLVTDTVEINGFSLPNTKFIEAKHASKNQEKQIYDGILGLRYNPKDPSNNIVSQLCIKNGPHQKFLFNLRSSPNQGTVKFCQGIDWNSYTVPDNYVNDIEPGSWKIEMTTNISLSPNIVHNATIDTGSNVILGPQKDVNSFYNRLGYKKTPPSEFKCNIITKWPSINFTIGNTIYNITKNEYVWKVKQGKMCQIAIYGLPKSTTEWILGEPFLKKVDVEFDITGKRIGFAPKI